MTARRALSAAVAAVVTAGALAGCERPTPLVGVVGAGTYLTTEASAYCEDDDPRSCRRFDRPVKTLRVPRGTGVGVEVAPEVAEASWAVFVNGKPFSPVQRDSTFYRLPPTDVEESFDLEVRAVRSPDRLGGTGAWRFRIESTG